jgi:hypothetical protein
MHRSQDLNDRKTPLESNIPTDEDGDVSAEMRKKSAAPTGFEPAISALTGPHVSRYTTEPLAGANIPYGFMGVKVHLNHKALNLWESYRMGHKRVHNHPVEPNHRANASHPLTGLHSHVSAHSPA